MSAIILTEKLTLQHGSFDCLISHACPSGGFPIERDSEFLISYSFNDPTLMQELAKEEALLSKVLETSGAKCCIYGHFHVSKQQQVEGVKYRCLNVNEVIEIIDDTVGVSLT